ncbi:MAG: hypothetical protein QOI31_847 [Solirubrobacterales bacterium]|jgi:hypothetical protein|nr:hypothetical protein [Solirubrobacterales bacterium]
MEHRTNIELAQQRSREIQSRTRSRWPDDGLPPRHRSDRPNGSLHPAAVLADLLWR